MLRNPWKLWCLLVVVAMPPAVHAQPGETAGTTAAPPLQSNAISQAMHRFYSEGQGRMESVRPLTGTLPGEHIPPDPNGLARFQMPTPTPGYNYAGVSSIGYNTDPFPETTGIRLDTTYGLVRSMDLGTYFSEHQFVGAGGFTVLPFQNPGAVIGVRMLGDYVDNESMVPDVGGFSLDLFGGTRYKATYLKLGVLWDFQDRYQKVGPEFSALTHVPLLGTLTLDSAFGFGIGAVTITPPINPVNFRFRAVRVADLDTQVRVGRFMNRNVQLGATANYYQYDQTPDEWGAGGFCNLYLGQFIIGGDVSGGSEGLRGFVTFSTGWGKSPCDRPQDWRVPVDTMAWVTRAPERDVQVKLRESFTGPLVRMPAFP